MILIIELLLSLVTMISFMVSRALDIFFLPVKRSVFAASQDLGSHRYLASDMIINVFDMNLPPTVNFCNRTYANGFRSSKGNSIHITINQSRKGSGAANPWC